MTDEFTQTDSDVMWTAAREKLLPVLRDQTTWLLHERGMHFTTNVRMGAMAGILTALTIEFLREAAKSATADCGCDECVRKAIVMATAAYIDGLVSTIGGHGDEGEVCE